MLAILYRVARNTPILLAANREEYFERPTQMPKIQPGSPRVMCGIDRQAGGTWLGVNQFGLLVTVTNRRKRQVQVEPRSRGLLCRELMDLRTAREAADHAERELRAGRYAGANYLVADAKSAAVVYGGDYVHVQEITPGLHTLSNGDLDDMNDERHQMVRRMLTLHKLDSAVTFLAVASRAFSRKPDSFGRPGVVLPGPEFGTVSSTLLSLARKIQQSTFQYSPGPPSDHPYEDLSALLRQVLSAGRNRNREAESQAEGEAGGEALSVGSASKPTQRPVGNGSGKPQPLPKTAHQATGAMNGATKHVAAVKFAHGQKNGMAKPEAEKRSHTAGKSQVKGKPVAAGKGPSKSATRTKTKARVAVKAGKKK
ncbi:MAG: NRDE family protein [Planctomycetota bacterium]